MHFQFFKRHRNPVILFFFPDFSTRTMKRLTNSGRDPIAILEGSNLLCMLVPMSTLDSKGTNARNIARIFERYNPFFLSIYPLPPTPLSIFPTFILLLISILLQFPIVRITFDCYPIRRSKISSLHER